jgi:mRNA interferase RelE/StbE
LSYRIELESRARREFLDLPRDVQERMAAALNDLRSDPRPPGAKRLSGSPGYRVRKGTYRVLYTIDDHTKIVRIYRIGHRREVYRGI